MFALIRIGTWLVILAVAVAFNCPQLGATWFKAAGRRLGGLARRPRTSTVLSGLTGTKGLALVKNRFHVLGRITSASVAPRGRPVDGGAPTVGTRRFPLALAAFAFGLALIVSRGPDRLFHAQFWADDAVFYAQAYQYGVRTILWPYSAYLNTLPRLVALGSLMTPLTYAPLWFAVVGLLIQALPVAFLLSERCRPLGGPWRRAALALAYIALPGTMSLDANLAYAQWHLAVLAFLVLIVEAPQGYAWKAFDRTALLATTLSSVFAVLLLPFAFVRRRHVWIVSCTALLQAGVMVASRQFSMRHPPLHASVRLLSAILTSHIFIGSLLGTNPWVIPAAASYATCAVGLALVAFAALKGTSELRFFLAFAALTLAASLAAPQNADWPLLASDLAGWRYWFIPGLGFVVALMFLLSRSGQPVRIAAGSLLVLGILALPWTWRYPALPDHQFAERARAWDRLPPGAQASFPTCPDPVVLRLTKR